MRTGKTKTGHTYLFCCVSHFRLAAHFYCTPKADASSNVKLLKNLLLAKVRKHQERNNNKYVRFKIHFQISFLEILLSIRGSPSKFDDYSINL